jgi:hypothetical protein
LGAYALDAKGRIWESSNPFPVFRAWYVQPTNPRLAANPTTNPMQIGWGFQYLSNADKVWECPTNKRRTPTRMSVNPNDPFWQTETNRQQLLLLNEFLSDRGLNFDYTMITGASGASVDLPRRVAYDTRCQTRRANQPRTGVPPAADLRFLRGNPVYMEEDSRYYNADTPDGLYSNLDQLTDRHSRKGHTVYLSGDVELLDLPKGNDPNSENDVGDFIGNDLWAKGTAANAWFTYCPSWPATPRPYGWLNSPRP